MIAMTSKAYPTTAVIQHYRLTGEAATLAHNVGRKLRDYCEKGYSLERMDALVKQCGAAKHMSEDAARHLVGNHYQASQHFGYYGTRH